MLFRSRRILDNLREFCSRKNASDLIFGSVTSDAVNRFLGRAYDGLTAKVFRTYHATNIVKDFLDKTNGQIRSDVPDGKKIYHAKLANLEAAIKCNHKRTPPKNWEQGLQKKEETLKSLQMQAAKTEKAEAKRKEQIGRASCRERV